jgi:hypothetical protein
MMTHAAAFLVALSLVPAADSERDDAWVTKRVREIRESDTEEWRKIPWSASLLDAAKLARDEQRLMFLFSHDGNIDTGRC